MSYVLCSFVDGGGGGGQYNVPSEADDSHDEHCFWKFFYKDDFT